MQWLDKFVLQTIVHLKATPLVGIFLPVPALARSETMLPSIQGRDGSYLNQH